LKKYNPDLHLCYIWNPVKSNGCNPEQAAGALSRPARPANQSPGAQVVSLLQNIVRYLLKKQSS